MIVFGHRGARGEAPENTLPGFAYARTIGLQAFELDVRLSADEQLVVVHDPNVDRTTNGTGPVSQFTAAELARLDARRSCPGWPEPAGIPRLVEVLDTYANQVRLAIEIKTDTPERLERVCALVIQAIEQYQLSESVVVSSFDPAALEVVGRLAPSVTRAFIGAFDAPHFLQSAIRLGCGQIDVPLSTGSPEVVREAHARGMRVVGWLGNTSEDLELLLRWGVDGCTSDFPARALAFFRERKLL
jgi:glycerophosphoryl diester phosphodiesterase